MEVVKTYRRPKGAMWWKSLNISNLPHCSCISIMWYRTRWCSLLFRQTKNHSNTNHDQVRTVRHCQGKTCSKQHPSLWIYWWIFKITPIIQKRWFPEGSDLCVDSVGSPKVQCRILSSVYLWVVTIVSIIGLFSLTVSRIYPEIQEYRIYYYFTFKS